MAGLKRSQLQQFAELVLQNRDKIIGSEERIVLAIAALKSALQASRDDNKAVSRLLVAEAIAHLQSTP